MCEKFEVSSISKIHIGKVIVKTCGNEGSEDSEGKANMRRLLQSTIEYLEKEKEKVWVNAEVTVYDDYGNTIIMVSGSGRCKFIVSKNGRNEVEFINTERPGVFSKLKSCLFGEESERGLPVRAISHPDIEDTVRPTPENTI